METSLLYPSQKPLFIFFSAPSHPLRPPGLVDVPFPLSQTPITSNKFSTTAQPIMVKWERAVVRERRLLRRKSQGSASSSGCSDRTRSRGRASRWCVSIRPRRGNAHIWCSLYLLCALFFFTAWCTSKLLWALILLKSSEVDLLCGMSAWALLKKEGFFF